MVMKCCCCRGTLEVDEADGSDGGGGGGLLETLVSAVMDDVSSSHGMDSEHGSPLSTNLCIDESGWYVPLLICSLTGDRILAVW